MAGPTSTESSDVPRLTMTMREAASALGISLSAAYDATHRGEIPCVRIGRRILVKRSGLLALADATDGADTSPAA